MSVYDKTGLEELALGLHAAGVELVSTGGSAALIESLGLPVTKVEDLTGFPECLDGRVKTLHPRVHAGILADRRLPEHLAQLDELGVAPFDLVVVNLYPFTETVASGAVVQECIEKIDIGGPSMVRAAAKNHASVAIVTDGADYADGAGGRADGGFTLAERERAGRQGLRPHRDVRRAGGVLDGQRAHRHLRRQPGSRPGSAATWDKAAVLRYGENPHQPAALYRTGYGPGGLAAAEQLHGKEMSYNNYVDTDAARRAAYDHGDRRRSRSSSTPTRAASPSAPMSPRRTGRRTRATRSPRSAA